MIVKIDDLKPLPCSDTKTGIVTPEKLQGLRFSFNTPQDR